MSFRKLVLGLVFTALACAMVNQAQAHCFGLFRRHCGYGYRSCYYGSYASFSYGYRPVYYSSYYAYPRVWSPSVYYSRVITPTYYYNPAPVYYAPAPVVIGVPFCATTPAKPSTDVLPSPETSPAGVREVRSSDVGVLASVRREAEASSARFRYASSFTPAPKIKASNATTLELARRFVGFGDQLFKKQRFQEALQQYKSATRVAPDLSEGYYRQGFALVATNRYELAAAAMKKGMQANLVTPAQPTLLDELYNGSALAQDAHRESLALAALDKMNDGDLFLLVGMFLKHEGQPVRATKFFDRAEKLLSRDEGNLLRQLRSDEPRVAYAKIGREI